MKKNITEIIIFGLFAIVGIGMFIGGFIIILNSREFHSYAVEITGEITRIESYRDRDGDRDYDVYVSYKYEGVEYVDIPFNEYNSGMYEGDLITLLVNPNNPTKIRSVNGDFIAGIIMIIMGLIFGAIGVIPTYFMMKKEKKKKYLLSQGRRIYAIVENVEINYNYSVNGRHPYVVYCRYTDEYSGASFIYKSENLWVDPYPYLQQGSQVCVMVDGTDYSQYYVDVESSLQGNMFDYT